MNFPVVESPVVDFIEPPFERPKKCPYDASLDDRALVLDGGSYWFRAGWSGESHPRLQFRNQITRPRSRWTNELCTVVGDFGGGVKGYDFGRASARNALDRNVVVNFETQEVILDYVFERLSLTGGCISHPVMMTECCLNPSYSRAQMSELLFEAYSIPAVHFATDSVCAYLYNRKMGSCGSDGLVVGSGHSATHVIPIVNGEPYYHSAKRMKPCGAVSTDHLQRLMHLKNPKHSGILNARNVALLKEQHSMCSQDYSVDLKSIQMNSKSGGNVNTGVEGLCIQLPWVSSKFPTRAEMEEEAAQKLTRAAEQRERLKMMAEKRKSNLIEEKEALLVYLQGISDQVGKASTKDELDTLLSEAGVSDIAELNKEITNTQNSLARLKTGGSSQQPDQDRDDVTDQGQKSVRKFDLLDVPDSDLTMDQITEKKRQRMLKNSEEARARAKARKEQEKVEQDMQREREDLELHQNPQAYLENLKERHRMVAMRMESRKRRRLGGSNTHSHFSSHFSSHLAGQEDMGTHKRVSEDQRRRMKLLAQAAGDESKVLEEDDGFGEDDQDWDVYKEMDRNYSDSEGEREDDMEYLWTTERLETLGEGASIVDLSGDREEDSRPHTAKDFQVSLTVERIRVPELLFQPCLAGIDQAGLPEVIGSVLEQMPSNIMDRCANGGLLITGGNAAFKGLDARLERELRAIRPEGHPIRVFKSLDFLLDAWKGASLLASVPGIFSMGYTKAEYEERGVDGLRRPPRLAFAALFQQ